MISDALFSHSTPVLDTPDYPRENTLAQRSTTSYLILTLIFFTKGRNGYSHIRFFLVTDSDLDFYYFFVCTIGESEYIS